MGNGCIDYNKGKVSVIVPVYNVGKYLEECLNSIINQTYKNIEMVIVNDGSTDNSLDIIEKFKNKDNRIKLINQINKGVSVARNIGLLNSTGNYIFFVDPDDYIEIDCINKLVEKINIDRSEMVIFNYIKVFDNELKEDIRINLNLDSNKVYTGRHIAELMLKNLIQGCAWFRFFKKENLTKHEFCFEEGRIVEDFFPVFKETCQTSKVSFLDDYLYKYRQREGSLVNSNYMKLMNDFVYSMKLTANYSYKMNFNKVIIEKFKLIKSCIVVKNYYEINKNNKNMYKEFKKNKLHEIFPNEYLKIIDSNNIKSVLFIISWKLQIYDKLSKLRYL